MSETMGQIIRRLRKERNLTQEELAEQLNITYQAVSRWENGTGMPDISQIVPLSNLFDVTTDVLFGIHDTDPVVDKEKIMDEYDQIDNPTESYEFIIKVLKQYPGHTDFLRCALSDGTQIVVRKLTDNLQKITNDVGTKGQYNKGLSQVGVNPACGSPHLYCFVISGLLRGVPAVHRQCKIRDRRQIR